MTVAHLTHRCGRLLLHSPLQTPLGANPYMHSPVQTPCQTPRANPSANPLCIHLCRLPVRPHMQILYAHPMCTLPACTPCAVSPKPCRTSLPGELRLASHVPSPGTHLKHYFISLPMPTFHEDPLCRTLGECRAHLSFPVPTPTASIGVHANCSLNEDGVQVA